MTCRAFVQNLKVRIKCVHDIAHTHLSECRKEAEVDV